MQIKKRWNNPALMKYTKYKCEKYIECDPSSLHQSSCMYWLLQFTLLQNNSTHPEDFPGAQQVATIGGEDHK